MTDTQSFPAGQTDDDRLRQLLHPHDWPTPQRGRTWQLLVIGGGTAGLVAAAGAAGVGAQVAMIEQNLLGGDCLNTGCVPSKALISTARQAAAVRNAAEFGIVGTEAARVDFSAVMQRMRSLREQIAPHDSAERFRQLGVDVFFGSATFTGPASIELNGVPLNFHRAIIATGGQPLIPAIPGLSESAYLTTETLFQIQQLPEHLVVLGGGPIGTEMAQTFARFGARVTLIESGAQILNREDSDAAALMQQQLEQHDGVDVLLNCRLLQVSTTAGITQLVLSQNDQTRKISCDQLLVAVGREARVSSLNLGAAGVDLTPDGLIRVNDFLQTSNSAIYAAGDVCTKLRFTHLADRMSRIAIRNSLFAGRARFSKLQIPRCTYTSPEIAQVGIDPATAARAGILLDTFTEPFAANDRAVLAGCPTGFVRIHVRRGTDRILGAVIVGEHAGELISEVSTAMAGRIGLKRLADIIHPYPTQADAIRRIGDQYMRTRLTPFASRTLKRWLNWRFRPDQSR